MICSDCGAAAFRILGHIELGRIGAAHENTVQRAHCADCGAVFLCLYEEERSVGMGRDNRVSHQAFGVSKVVWRMFAFAFEAPKPKVSAGWRRRIGRWLHAKCDYKTLKGSIALRDQTGAQKLASVDR